jgi:CRP-like cAMP-binding protein
MKLDIRELFQHADGVRDYPPFSTIFEEGEPGDCMFVLLEGMVTISIKGVDVWHIRAGEVFGEMALIDRRPRSASAISRTSVRVARIDEAGFMKLVHDTPAFSLYMMRLMAKRLRALDETIS